MISSILLQKQLKFDKPEAVKYPYMDRCDSKTLNLRRHLNLTLDE